MYLSNHFSMKATPRHSIQVFSHQLRSFTRQKVWSLRFFLQMRSNWQEKKNRFVRNIRHLYESNRLNQKSRTEFFCPIKEINSINTFSPKPVFNHFHFNPAKKPNEFKADGVISLISATLLMKKWVQDRQSVISVPPQPPALTCQVAFIRQQFSQIWIHCHPPYFCHFYSHACVNSLQKSVEMVLASKAFSSSPQSKHLSQNFLLLR